MKERKTSVKTLMTILIAAFSATVILFSIITCFVFFRWKNNEKTASQQLSLFSSSVTAFDSIVEQYHELSLQITSSPSIRSYVIADVSTLDSTRDNLANAMAILAIAKSQHYYLDNIWVYDTRKNLILDNHYNESALPLSAFGDITQQYLEKSVEKRELWYNGWYSNLFWYQDRLFIAREYPTHGSSSLGILYIELDVHKLFSKQLLNDSLDRYQAAFDEHGTVLGPLTTMRQEDIDVFRDMLLTETTSQTIRNQNYFLIQSELTGYYYGRCFHSSNAIGMGEFLPLVFFMLAVICCAAILFSKLVFIVTIQPLQNLSSEVNTYFDMDETNEISALMKSVSMYANQEQRNTAILPYIKENFFIDLCDGKKMSLQYITTVLQEIGNPIDPSGIYWATIVSFSELRSESLTDLVIRRIAKCLRELEEPGLKFYTQSMVNNFVITIIQVPIYLRPEQILFLQDQITQTLIEYLSAVNPNLYMGVGESLSFLPDISKSVRTAISNSMRLGDIPTGGLDAAAEVQNADPISEQILAFANRLMELVNSNRLWQAEEDIKQQLDLYARSTASLTHFHDVCYRLTYVMHEMAEKDGAVSKNLFASMPAQADHELGETENAIRENTMLICMSCMNVHAERNKKKNHQLIVAAEKYINEHFSDPDMSLSTVAAAINTNPTYFSKLFKKNLGINYVDYCNQKRIERSKELLRDTDLTVKAIATQVGFYTEQNFFRTFKKLTDQTPSQYRSACREAG